MRLYVVCHNATCHTRIYIGSTAKERNEINSSFELTCPVCGTVDRFINREVFAETSVISGPGVAILSGFIGVLVAGPIGGFIGAVGGGTIGVGIAENDRRAVERFNQSE